jgi:hypothetical protein
MYSNIEREHAQFRWQDLSGNHGRDALLDTLLKTHEAMPIVLPQEILSFLIRDLSQILSNINIVPKVSAWLELPKIAKRSL